MEVNLSSVVERSPSKTAIQHPNHLFQNSHDVVLRNGSRQCSTIELERGLGIVTSSARFFSEALFHEMMSIQTKRNYRQSNPFLYISIDVSILMKLGKRRERIGRIARLRMVNKIKQMLHATTREVDIKGWLRKDEVIGIMCTDVEKEHHKAIVGKIKRELLKIIDQRFLESLTIKWKSFPLENTVDDKTKVYSLKELALDINCDVPGETMAKKQGRGLKRLLDIVGSLFAIAIFSPIFIILTIVIKLTSKGPALFKQERVGKDGMTFNFLKFRSMHANNDNSIHREFITKFIKGEIKAEVGNEKPAYKMKDDPRVTKIGKFIRKTSLDELPQLINVLKGEMSLVGPRPPIAYEVEKYDRWHTRRVLDVKPGITGFWQVEGRSSTAFDAMVRMDLQYSMNWSLWLDIKLLVKTPFAVFTAKGAC